MKITRRLMGFAAALMALTACSDSEDMLSAFHNDPVCVARTFVELHLQSLNIQPSHLLIQNQKYIAMVISAHCWIIKTIRQ